MKYIKLFTGTRRLGSMGSTTTNGKNHILPIDSGTLRNGCNQQKIAARQFGELFL